MTVTLWKFTALDTFFFRGAAPFNAGEGGQGGQASMFPPTMSTLQGAIRYQLAIGQGWQPNSALPIELGDSDDLGQLRLRGPYLFYNDDLLLPCPLLVIRRLQGHGMTTQVNYHRLAPGQKTVKCVLGSPVINTHNGSNQSSYGCRRRKRIGNHRGSGVGFAEKSHVPRYIKY
jgi:CRISPR-associated protein Cmr3